MSKIIDAESYIKHDQEAGNGKTVLNRKQNKIIDTDEVQAVYEDYIRHGCTNAFPSKVITA